MSLEPEPETRGDEVEEAADPPVGVAGDDYDAVCLVPAAEAVHRHREAALQRAAAPEPRHLLELGDRRLVDVAQVDRRRRVPGCSEPAYGLAHLSAPSAFERDASARRVACVTVGRERPARVAARGSDLRRTGSCPDVLVAAEDAVGVLGWTLRVDVPILFLHCSH